ncbi:unnamed protein product [Malus baccata var. baccata]
MTRSSQPIHKHIRDFDDDFERTLRRRRNQQESNPLSLEPNLEEQVPKEEEIPTAQVGEVVQDMAMDNRTLKELAASGLDNAAPLCIQYPTAAQGKTKEFELKSSLLHHIPKYHGLSMEDPNKHLKEFEVVCSSMTPVNVDGSILKMKAFPFSLMEKAKDWLYDLAPGTITTWESMKRAFLEKFFPTSRIILLRKKISGIQQEEGESFPTYYERFKSLVVSCPHHQMKEELLLQYFYEGLLPLERQMLDASAGGLVDKTPLAAKILIANRALNAQQYEGIGQRGPPRQQVHEGQENQTKAMQSQDKRVDQVEKQIGQIADFNEEEEKDVLETFRKVHVNIPLLDAIKQIPKSNAYPKGVLEDVLVQVNHLIFPADFYVLEMDKSDHAPSLPILFGRPFMKTAQTKIDVAKGLVTMAFGGDMISFKISESIETPNVVHSCCAIDKIEKIGPDHSALGTKDAPRTMQDEGIGVEHKDHTATALKMLKLAERTMGKNVHIAATLSQHIGKPPNPNPIPIKVDRWFPSLVQVPKQIPDGGRMNMNLRQHNTPINKHHYPFPFKDVIYENFVEHVVEDIPLHVVGSSGE